MLIGRINTVVKLGIFKFAVSINNWNDARKEITEQKVLKTLNRILNPKPNTVHRIYRTKLK